MLYYFIAFVWILFFSLVLGNTFHYYDHGTFGIKIFQNIASFHTKLILLSIAIISFLTLFIVIQRRFFKHKLDNRANCQIQFVDMEKISNIWLDRSDIERIEQNKKSSLTNSFYESGMVKTSVLDIVFNYRIRNTDIIKDYIVEYINAYDENEIEIACVLLAMIEHHGDVPSVVSLFDKDNEKIELEKVSITNKKNSYQILKNIKLEQHILNVVRHIFEIGLKSDKSMVNIQAPKMLIAALSHDIGKITNFETLNKIHHLNLEEKIFATQHHEFISDLILKNKFPSYKSIDLISEVVKFHHLSIEDTEENRVIYSLGTLLKEADSSARKQEIREYREKETKKDNSESDKKNEENNKEEDQSSEQKSSQDYYDDTPILNQKNIQILKHKISKAQKIKNEDIDENETNEKNQQTEEDDMQNNKGMGELSLGDQLIIDNFNEFAFKSLLKQNLISVEELPQGRNRLNSIASKSGKYVYFQFTYFKNVIRQVLSDGDEFIKITDKKVIPVLQALTNNDIIKSQKILISNAPMVFSPRLAHTTYRMESKYLGYSESEMKMLQRASRYFHNAETISV
ncbi:metal-dependent phosphohydrolase (plasmid) [Aliarcobacter cibarius]|uniref:HD domain-containing protein n=1 Tax=Aliarcobacter cibarius TaxID=255507 RepID=UPI00124603AA|nr:HD domain-containing protein [Aliarcobacter cibarius]QEZ90317.1 metal-dependent phosphohydrolase [Aliarcobacter cibarius]